MKANYTYTFVIPGDPLQAYAAASNPAVWWGEMIQGDPSKLDETFLFHVPGLHYSLFKVIDATPGQRLAWAVIPSGNPAEHHEWVGTKVVFEFALSEAGTKIVFTHEGLNPSLECHEVCSTAWNHHLTIGLQALLTTGEGQPMTFQTIDEVARKIGVQTESENQSTTESTTR